MKTSKLLIAAVAVLTFVASPVLAAEPGTWTLRAGVGMVSPKSNNLVFTVEIQSNIQIAAPHFTCKIMEHYNGFDQHSFYYSGQQKYEKNICH